MTGNKCELTSRAKAYAEHPDILNGIQNCPEVKLITALHIDGLNDCSLQWNSTRENVPFVCFETVERYVKTREQTAQALQKKGYRIFASKKIVSIQMATVYQNELLVMAFGRQNMESKPARVWDLVD